MSFRMFEEAALLEVFRLEAARRLEESRVLWEAYAWDRKLRSVVDANGLPGFEGASAGVLVAVAAVGSIDDGFRTRASANAKVALRGRVEVMPVGDWDTLVGTLVPRHFFGDEELDRQLVVKRSSEPLAHTVLDPRVTETVRVLAPQRLSLTYIDGVIGLEWAGVEREARILDDVLDVLGYLAVRGPDQSPYR